MNEYGKHEVYKEKLGSICEENNLTYSLRVDRYPCTLTIKPLGGMDAQLGPNPFVDETDEDATEAAGADAFDEFFQGEDSDDEE